MYDSPTHPIEPGDATEQAALEAVGINPFIGISPRLVAEAVGRWLLASTVDPRPVIDDVADFARRAGRTITGKETPRPATDDRRFADPAWQRGFGSRLAGLYVAAEEALRSAVEHPRLDDKSIRRARFAATLLAEVIAPSNLLLSNPAALRTAVQTRGVSLVRGVQNLARDVTSNRGMPALVDESRFRVGQNLATSPGDVVHRDQMMEVIQYRPTTPTVHAMPLLIIPSPVNRFYVVDLEPTRSLVRHLLEAGIAVHVVSWHNPQPTDWDRGLVDYVEAAARAVDVVLPVTSERSVSLLGLCAGGTIASVLAAHLANTRQPEVIRSLTLAVSALDMSVNVGLDDFATHRAASRAARRSSRRGVVRGDDLAILFAWLRSRDLVWSLWVNHVLLGQDPPTNAVLYWSQDVTNLPARLHADLLDIYVNNRLVTGGLTVADSEIDLRRVTCDSYLVAGSQDHLSPWEGVLASARLLGGRTTVTLASGGHIESLLAAPGRRRDGRFRTALGDTHAAAEEWVAAAQHRDGSWWPHWIDWLATRSGPLVPVPPTGKDMRTSVGPAPGRYVHG